VGWIPPPRVVKREDFQLFSVRGVWSCTGPATQVRPNLNPKGKQSCRGSLSIALRSEGDRGKPRKGLEKKNHRNGKNQTTKEDQDPTN